MTTKTDRDMLARLVRAAGRMAREVPDHECPQTEGERAFYDELRTARRFLAGEPCGRRLDHDGNTCTLDAGHDGDCGWVK